LILESRRFLINVISSAVSPCGITWCKNYFL